MHVVACYENCLAEELLLIEEAFPSDAADWDAAKISQPQPITLHHKEGLFGVRVIISLEARARSGHPRDRTLTRSTSAISVEVEGPLPGGGESQELAERCRGAEPAFADAARATLQRIILHIESGLRMPLMSRERNIRLINPTWRTASGERIKTYHLTLIGAVFPFPRVVARSAISAWQLHDHPLTTPLEITILCHAQSALLEGDVRRAVVDAATACEIATKTFLFGREPVTSAAIDFLEGRLRITVPELLRQVMQEAAGCNLKEDDESTFKQVENLFRARNRTVHRGELKWRDNKEWVIVTREVAQVFIKGVWRTMDWLEGVRSALESGAQPPEDA